MTAADRKLTEPLWTASSLLGGCVLAGAALVAISAAFGGTIGGFGRLATVCASQPNHAYGNVAAHLNVAARPGATVTMTGTLQACAPHPDFSQRLLDTLTSAPSVLVWAVVALLLWRLAWCAREDGPFTAAIAARLRVLGWVVLIGALAAATAQGAATDALLNTMLQARTAFGDAISGALRALPVPALTWAGLLTFARLVRRAAAMDDELQATV